MAAALIEVWLFCAMGYCASLLSFRLSRMHGAALLQVNCTAHAQTLDTMLVVDL